MNYIVRQADSLWIDYTLENWESIFATWDTTWTGTFEISASESSTPLYTGSLTRSLTPGLFQLRLNTDSASTSPVLAWTALAVGSYKLMSQFANSTAKYRKERHDSLTVKTQGL